LAVSAFTREKANHAMRGQFDFAEILKDYQKALKLEPKNTTVLLWIGGFYEKLGFVEKSIKFYKQCMEQEPSYKPCVANYLSSLEYTGLYQEAIDLYIENVGNGLLNSQDAPLEALAQLKQKLPFIMAINSEFYFKGWQKNHEIYQSYQMPQSDHSELIKEAVNWVSRKEKEPLYWRYVLMPIGYEPDPKIFHEFYEVFLYKPKNINSLVIKKYLKDTGVFNYWQQHGYPSQCKPLGEEDFECE
jgi:tetratricopeptide (TPR) repeat protein